MRITFKKIFTKSNLLSFSRLLMAIPFWFLLENLQVPEIRFITLAVCILGAGTDILDGYLARRFNEVTELGKIIDPLADKVVISVIIIKLFILNLIPGYYFYMIIIRDLLILVGGIFIANKLGKVLPSNILGKITVVNIALVILMIILQVGYTNIIFRILYILSIILIIVSLSGYAVRAFEFMKRKNYDSI